MQRLGSLVETQTEDGLRLNGFWQTASTDSGPNVETNLPSNIDVGMIQAVPEARPVGWIIVHGVAGNFYNSSMLASLSETLLELGQDTWRINTRGRDPIAYFATSAGNTRVGAAYEMISDCLADLHAWIALLKTYGYRRIGLLGHSLGALKAAYFASETATKGVDYLICVSPPRLVPEILSQDSKYASSFAEDTQQAKAQIEMGKPETLLSVRFPQPMLISAATFLDKYGQKTQHDYVRMARQIAIPSLWCFGELEVRGNRASFRDCDRDLKSSIDAMGNHRVEVIANADHAYSQARKSLNSAVRQWVAQHV